MSSTSLVSGVDMFSHSASEKTYSGESWSKNKDSNFVLDLTEGEDIKKRWKEYMEELYKKDLHNPDNHNGVITHLEPDILECKVKWALGNVITNKASGGDRIPVISFFF